MMDVPLKTNIEVRWWHSDTNYRSIKFAKRDLRGQVSPVNDDGDGDLLDWGSRSSKMDNHI